MTKDDLFGPYKGYALQGTLCEAGHIRPTDEGATTATAISFKLRAISHVVLT
jgi:hypothetical protein